MTCPLCSSPVDAAAPIAEVHDAFYHANGGVVEYYFCYSCEAVFHNEAMPDNYYHAQYRVDVQHGSNDTLVGEVMLQKTRAASLAPYLSMIVRDFKPKTSLDMGASAGVLVKMLSNAGLEAEGVELDEIYGAYAQSNYGLEYKALDELACGKYDLVTCIHTLEHLTDPLGTLRQLRQAASEDALLLVEVPDFRTSPLSLAYVHKFAFTEQSLYNVLLAAGWFPAWIIPFWGIHKNFAQPSNLLAFCMGGVPVTRFEYNQQTARLGQSMARKE